MTAKLQNQEEGISCAKQLLTTVWWKQKTARESHDLITQQWMGVFQVMLMEEGIFFPSQAKDT